MSKIRDNQEIDHRFTEEIVCPWCGDSWTGDNDLKPEATELCSECRQPYKYETNYSVTYITEKIFPEESQKTTEREVIGRV